MTKTFAEIIKEFRMSKNLSQQQLAEMLFVDRSSVARWENGKRIPDTIIVSRLAKCLEIDVNVLLNSIESPDEIPNVILVDNEKIILTGGLPILEEALPYATITGFTKPSDALKFAQTNRINIAFLDIEMGKTSGFELCQKLLEINPRTNIIFLTAYPDYSLDAWDTGACGFITKPLSVDDISKQITKLRFPIR